MMELITNTFVKVAADCPVEVGTVPKPRGETPTVAVLQHELLLAKPYRYTLEELMWELAIRREGLTKAETKTRKDELESKLFGKPYPCMRASPLPKTFGWGVHYDAKGKLAIYGMESNEYAKLANEGNGLAVFFAMRSKRAV